MAQERRRLLSELVMNPFRDTNMRHKASVCQQTYIFSSSKNEINSLQMKDNYMMQVFFKLVILWNVAVMEILNTSGI